MFQSKITGFWVFEKRQVIAVIYDAINNLSGRLNLDYYDLDIKISIFIINKCSSALIGINLVSRELFIL